MKNLFLFLILLITLACNKNAQGIAQDESDSKIQTPMVTDGKDPSPETPELHIEKWSEEFLELINNQRASIGLRSLISHEGLNEVARIHSQNMANRSVLFGHIGFAKRCKISRSILGGGNWCGENVAMGQETPMQAFMAWMNSPGHRVNIDHVRPTHSGFGFAKNAKGRYYWTHFFLEY